MSQNIEAQGRSVRNVIEIFRDKIQYLRIAYHPFCFNTLERSVLLKYIPRPFVTLSDRVMSRESK